MTQAFAMGAIGGSHAQGEFRDSNQLVASCCSDSQHGRWNMGRGMKFLSCARQPGDLEGTAEMQADVLTVSSTASLILDASTRTKSPIHVQQNFRLSTGVDGLTRIKLLHCTGDGTLFSSERRNKGYFKNV
ncbi:hypothetical protein L914_12579 [Phytophthora nicotianae]|uniref:Uncharacterized protein n=1 Tax=Phytophthora nicotianae TaxID=4792 RepID=W2N1V4_PHYNI|nr:hypothetical protein L914_12579 [Phytophthora nicotianae]